MNSEAEHIVKTRMFFIRNKNRYKTILVLKKLVTAKRRIIFLRLAV